MEKRDVGEEVFLSLYSFYVKDNEMTGRRELRGGDSAISSLQKHSKSDLQVTQKPFSGKSIIKKLL